MCNALFYSTALRRLIHSHPPSPGQRNAQRQCFASITPSSFPLIIVFRVFQSVCFPSLLSSLLIDPPRPTEWSSEALRRHVRRRDQGTGDTGSTTCKSRCIRDFSHPFRQGSDLPCAVMRKCRRLQGCPQSIHKGSKSYPGNHGHRRFQGGKCSRKTRYAVEGVY